MNSTTDQLCTTCGDTGHWEGEPDPCPECGAFTVKRKEPKSLRYIEKHEGPNRHERRARKAKERKQR